MTVQARETFAHSGNQMEDAGTQRPDDDPLVLAFPAHYEPLDEPAPRRGRPPGSKTKPKDAADG